MNKQFTKQEAIALLGCTVIFKKPLYFEAGELKFPLIQAGSKCSVDLVENNPEGVLLGVLWDEQYHFFNKRQFNQYCQVLPEDAVYASAGSSS